MRTTGCSLAEMPPSVTSESVESIEEEPSKGSAIANPQSMRSALGDKPQKQPQAQPQKRVTNRNQTTPTMSREKNTMIRQRNLYPLGADDEPEPHTNIDIFERPSWFESLQRLKWCCPGVPGISIKEGVERRVRTHSESTSSSRSSRQPSPIAVAPAYHWEANQHPPMPFPPVPQGYPHPHQQYPGYHHPHPGPYHLTPNGYSHPRGWAGGYPHIMNPYPGPQPYHPGMAYPVAAPPPPLFQNKTMGYVNHPNIVSPERQPPPQTTTETPEIYHPSQFEDSGTESEVSFKSQDRRRRSIGKPKQRQINRPPLVQRRATAPVHSSALSTPQKESGAPLPSKLPPTFPKNSPMGAARPRLPSEMSRTSVNTTSSRHRRQAHESFEFSTNSLREIANHPRGHHAASGMGPPPLNFVEVQPTSFSRMNSWSSWDDQTHNESDNSLLLSPDEDELVGYISPVDEEGHSPARRPVAKDKPADWMLQWATAGPQDKCSHHADAPPSPAASKASRVSEAPAVPTKDTVTGPVYLPVSPDMDQAIEANGETTLVFSGWVAMSAGTDMRTRVSLAEGKEVPIVHKDICYLQLVRFENEESCQYSLKIHTPGSEDIKTIPLSRDLQAQSQEISGRAGRCVILQDAWTRKVQWTILPVSLPSYFFRQGKLISERHFMLLQSAMFTPFYNATMGIPQEWSAEYCNMRYAPDEQHDAAMHILFSMDAALSSVH